MRFAIVGNGRREAEPKLSGICSSCGGAMIAKCGKVKVWHWAHKGAPPCDPWWESETDWHRQWKDQFPKNWQEIVAVDQNTGEKHIADVRTSNGRVIEIQHSAIHPDEVGARERFYGNMIWIVDGKRGELDESYFNMGLHGPTQYAPLTYGIKWYGRSRLLQNWASVSAEVYLDFGKSNLFRLLAYDPIKKEGLVGIVMKNSMVDDLINGRGIRGVSSIQSVGKSE